MVRSSRLHISMHTSSALEIRWRVGSHAISGGLHLRDGTWRSWGGDLDEGFGAHSILGAHSVGRSPSPSPSRRLAGSFVGTSLTYRRMLTTPRLPCRRRGGARLLRRDLSQGRPCKASRGPAGALSKGSSHLPCTLRSAVALSHKAKRRPRRSCSSGARETRPRLSKRYAGYQRRNDLTR
jgi:hypothetical protein